MTANLFQESVVQAELVSSSAFVLEVDECTGISLLPHSSCLLGVRFTAQQEGPETAVLQIGDIEVDFIGAGWPINEGWVSERSGLDFPRLIPALGGENFSLVQNRSGQVVTNIRGETVNRTDVFVDLAELCVGPQADGGGCIARVQFLPLRVGGYVDTVFVSADAADGEVFTTPISVAGVALPPEIWPYDTSDLPPPDLPQP